METASKQTSITPGAVRMRASRQRRRQRMRCITLDIREAEIKRLVDLGHLRAEHRDDKNELLLALYRFLDASALGDPHP